MVAEGWNLIAHPYEHSQNLSLLVLSPLFVRLMLFVTCETDIAAKSRMKGCSWTEVMLVLAVKTDPSWCLLTSNCKFANVVATVRAYEKANYSSQYKRFLGALSGGSVLG